MSGAVAIIPARGGSKRLPRKNLLPFLGKPLLAHTVEAAVASGVFDEVLMTSDSQEILDTAARYGATPVLRPPEYATDTIGFFETVLHALSAGGREGAEAICLLMPNCPLRDKTDIIESKRSFASCGSDFQISVFRYHMFNPFWALRMGANGLEAVFPEHFPRGGKLAESAYCPTGAVWWARRAAYLEAKDFYGPGAVPFELPWWRAVDIDTARDFHMAELVATALRADPRLADGVAGHEINEV